jgi:RNA polymerase sigma-70 factor (ECF subfamily)
MSDSHADPEEVLDAGTLFGRHAQFVANFLWKLGVGAQEIEDLVQEVFMVAHKRGGFVSREARPTTWLAEIAIRVASTRRRSLGRAPTRVDLKDVHGLAAPGSSPAAAAEASQGLGRVQRALESMDVNHRAVFVLYELEGESCEDIAKSLEIPVGTVHSRLHTARKSFQKMHTRLVNLEHSRRTA